MSKTTQVITLAKTLSKVKKLMYEGLKNDDWSKMRDATNIMFGTNPEISDGDDEEFLAELKKEIDNLKSRVESIENLFKSTQSTVINLNEPVIIPLSKQPAKSENIYDFTVKNKKEVKTSNITNKFESISIASNEIEDDLSSINDSVERVPRTRKPFALIDVTCTNCNKKLQVKSVLVRENYVCDRCINKRIF